MSISKSEVIRFIENVKVYIRGNRVLNIVARMFYFPVWLTRKARIFLVARRDSIVAIQNIRKINENEDFLIYLGKPIDKNLGDTAQYVCIIKWLNQNYPNKKIVEVKTAAFRDRVVRIFLNSVINKDTVFFIQSGETFDNRHPDHAMHRLLFEKYTNQPMVFFPQTIYFTDDNEQRITKNLMEKLPRTLLLARDEVSYDIATSNLNYKKCVLYPDIVTSLIGQNYVQESARNGILICKRVDGEKKVYDKDLKKYTTILESEFGCLDVTDTDFYCSYDETYKNPEYHVKKKIEQFSKYNLVITDRYHGMIFSLIANTPCIVLETHGHKVVAGEKMFESYFGKQAICLVKDLEDLVDTTREMYGNICTNSCVINDEFFEPLKQLIDENID